ncbi:MAG: hypothetical protein OXG13_09680 [Gemmatimonadaceae bacterium]|nr:hypothetical protein [Gemmatimonadaceae bacterium]
MDTPRVFGCTYRGLIVGTLGCIVVGAGFNYSTYVLRVGAFSTWHYTIGANLMLFLMALMVNPLLGLLNRNWVLTPPELAQVYVMWIVGSGVATNGLPDYLLPHITSMAYYISPENAWAEAVIPFIPDWVVPSHYFQDIRGFYEGSGDGTVPWGMWLPVLLIGWGPMAMCLWVAMVSVAVILRKQWIDHERLVYPMMQLPIAMIQDDADQGARPGLVKPLFRNWIFWLGFILPFIIGVNNGLTRYFPLDPIHVGGQYVYLFREVAQVRLGISFMMLGFAYFIRRDVTLGICFYYFVYMAYQIISTLIGGGDTDPLMSPWTRSPTTFSFEGLGAFIALVVVGLWNGRRHIVAVVRRALGLSSEVDASEGDEIMSYRTAVLLFAGSFSFICFWLWLLGLPAWIAPLYLGLAFLLYLGITRVVCEGGIPWFACPIIASDAIVGGLGTRALGPTGIVALGFTYAWAADMIILVMTCAAQSLKVVEETIRRHRRMLLASMLIAIAVSICGGMAVFLGTAYEHGGLNITHTLKEQGYYQWQDAAARLQTSTLVNWGYWGHTGLGALVMGLLMFARQRLVWWPFHPIGFPVSLATHKMFLTILFAWAIKTAVLRLGGPRLYNTLKPLFLGLIIGEWSPKIVILAWEWGLQNL